MRNRPTRYTVAVYVGNEDDGDWDWHEFEHLENAQEFASHYNGIIYERYNFQLSDDGLGWEFDERIVF